MRKRGFHLRTRAVSLILAFVLALSSAGTGTVVASSEDEDGVYTEEISETLEDSDDAIDEDCTDDASEQSGLNDADTDDALDESDTADTTDNRIDDTEEGSDTDDVSAGDTSSGSDVTDGSGEPTEDASGDTTANDTGDADGSDTTEEGESSDAGAEASNDEAQEEQSVEYESEADTGVASVSSDETDSDEDTDDSEDESSGEDEESSEEDEDSTDIYDLANGTLTLAKTSYTYDGSAKTPGVTVKNYEGTTLTSGTDYTVSYASGRTNPGTYKVTVTGKGSYSGTLSASFTVTEQTLSSSNVTLSKTSYTYDGKAKKPTVTVKNAAGTTLTSGTHYTVSYASGRKNAGTYKVTVTGKGYYTGTVTKTFTINQKSLSSVNGKLTLSKTSYTYNGSARKPSTTVKITWNGKTKKLTKGTDYTVTYKNNTKAGTATVTVTGTGNFKGTLKKTFKITKVNLSTNSSAKVTLSSSTCTYSGSACKPTPTVKIKLNGKTVTLTKGTDYTVSYKNNSKIGKATVTIKGKGSFKGTLTKTFTIKPKKVTISSISSEKSGITVKWSKLSGGVSYQIAYKKSGSSSWSYVKAGSSSKSKTISSLTADKVYYVKVRAYKVVSGKTYYGSWSSQSSITVDSGYYVDASTAYELLNEFRTTSGVWYWASDDSTKVYFNKSGYTYLSELEVSDELEETAEIRAKELAESFSHTRPDGTSCFTIYPGSCTVMGENIALCSTSASTAISLWKEDSYSYSGQGHRRNMLGSYYTSVGIACYVKNGKAYWCMALGN